MRLTIAIALLGSLSSAQTTWYVDVNATPPGAGTQASPYASIQYAHDRATTVDGDTLLVAPGAYAENTTLSKGITVRATGGAEVSSLLQSGPGPILTLFGPDIDVLIVEDFTITGCTGSSAVRSGEGTLRRCIVRGNAGLGVETLYDTFLEDCTIAGNGGGVEASTLGEFISMRNCVVWGNGQNVYMNPQPNSLIHHCAGGPFPFHFGPVINGDPGLWDVAGGDYRLRPGSPCIDAGDPALPNDPDGSIGDIGYHAYDPFYAPITTYCTGKLNSHGCVPAIAASGLPSLTSPNHFLVTASLVLPFRRGLLLYSLTQDAAPFQGATLCVAQPYRRVGGQTSQGAGTCGGTFAYDFNIRIQSGADPALVPGVFVFTQWWHRDPNDPAGFQSGMTGGLRFGIAP